MSTEHHDPGTTVEYDYITDGIYIGTNVCCRIHFDEKLKTTEGIEADISLEGERSDNPVGVPFYLWLPVPDLHAPTQDQLAFGVSAIAKFVALKKKMYIHCRNGHGRAPTMVAAYLAKEKGMGVDEAFAYIKKNRPAIHPEEVQVAAVKKFVGDV